MVEVGGNRRELDAVITEQIPDERIAWTSTDGPDHAGVVTFHRVADGETKIMLQVDGNPETTRERVADAVGLVRRRVKGDLQRFKTMIEERGAGNETGAWRGEVRQDPTR